MAKRLNNPTLAEYDSKTEACPRMTRRWRRDVLPELVAWLELHKARCSRSLGHARQAAREHPSAALTEAVAKMETRLGVLQELQAQVFDKWDDYVWWEVAKLVETTMRGVGRKPAHVRTVAPVQEDSPPKKG